MKQKFFISGMTCSACSSHVKKCVSSLEGVNSCDVSLLTNQMIVDYDNITEKDIILAVSNAGYKASLTRFEEKNYHKQFDKLIISIFLLVILMYVAMFDMLNLPIPSFIENPMVNVSIQFGITSTIIVLFFHFFSNGFKRLFQLAPNMDSLIAIGSTASYLYGIYYLIFIYVEQLNGNIEVAAHLRHNLFFDSAAMILVFTSIGKLLEAKSKKRALKSVEDLVEMVPNMCNKIVDGKEIVTPLEEVKIGDVLISKVGDVIPLDGIVVEGEASINEASITGEPLAVDKFEASTLISGTLILDGVVKYQVTSTNESSTITQITKRVLEAANSKPKIEKFADKIAAYFVPIVILISLLTFVLWIIFSGDLTSSFNFAISVLVISCPCALGLATPVAVMVASGVGAKNNLLFKDSEVLEKITHINVILLDKTGTITTGNPSVFEYKTKLLDSDFFRILDSLESNSNHPIAKSITNYAKNFNYNKETVTDYTNKIGYGISGVIDGVKYYIGNNKYINSMDVSNPYGNVSGVGLYLFTQKEVLGYVSLKDEINKHSLDAINYWHKKGIKVCVLTGDTLENTKNLLSGIWIDEIYASLLPENKEEIVTNYLEKGYNVMMIGDGINDSIALSKATIGVAIASGTDVAANSSDLVLARHDLMDVVGAMELGKKTFKIIKENLFWALIYNVIGIPIASGVLSFAGIKLTPMIASICMSISSIFVVTNALRIQGFKRKENENMFEMKISVPSMMCKHCEARVIDTIKKISSVKNVKVDLKKKTVLIKSVFELDFNEVSNLLKQSGYEASLLG